MEYGGILQHPVPLHHASLQSIERGILAVIDHTGVAHSHRFLEIISAQAIATTHHMLHIQTELSQMHQGCLAYLTVRHSGNILHVIAQVSQRDSGICLTASIIAIHAMTLE